MGLPKRVFDIFLSMLLGIAFIPIFGLIIFALKTTSPGPILFRQERLGKGGTTFKMNKIRKFPANWGSQGPSVTTQYDSRMTKVGQFLERSKLDELPQLWNILLGEMSFVGPRPESQRFSHLFTGDFAKVLDYTPGIFGPNQTKYRNESSMYPKGVDPDWFYETELFPKKAKADINYFSKSNFLSDLMCIFTGTFAIVFTFIIWRKSTKSSLILLAWDVLTILSAWVLTHWLKYSVVVWPSIKPSVAVVFKSGLIITPLALILVFGLARVYRHPVRFFSETDFYRLVGATCAAWIVAAAALGLLFNSISSLLLAISCVVSIFLMVIPRAMYSQWHSAANNGRSSKASNNSVNILVCGISEQSIELCNLLKTGFNNSKVIGILAENNDQVRREIHGFEVVGQPSDLAVLQTRYSIDQVWLSTNLGPSTQHKIRTWCSANKVEIIFLSELAGFKSLVSPKRYDNSLPTPKRGAKTSTRSRKEPEVAI